MNDKIACFQRSGRKVNGKMHVLCRKLVEIKFNSKLQIQILLSNHLSNHLGGHLGSAILGRPSWIDIMAQDV